MKKYLSFGQKIAKTSLVDPEIICVLAVVKKEEKRKKLEMRGKA